MWARLRSFAVMVFRRTQWERDLRDEFAFHLAARADALERDGLTREEASRRACLEFRGIETAKERCREARGTRWLDELSRNLVVAVRSIRKNPGFSTVAVLSLALGIGGNLAVFGVLHRLVLTDLPVQDANQLYEVVVVSQNRTDRGMSYPKFELIRDNFTFFKPVFGWGEVGRYPLAHGTTEQIVRVHAVTGNYFEALGLDASIGRLFTSADDHSDQVVVLSHELWRVMFARDPGVVGRSVKIGKAPPMVVVGIAPPGFQGMTPSSPVEVFLTLPGFEHLQTAVRQRANFQWFHVIGRLTGDVAVDAARAIVREQWPRLDEGNRRRYQRNTRDILLLEDASQGFSPVGLEFSGAVAVLMGLVAAVFLIACANLATMLFVRGAGRVREMSIRFALGAARSQLVGQWITECLMLAVIGGIAGVFAARWITDLLLLFVAESDRPWLRFESRPGVVLLASALTISAGLLCGLVPALRATRTRPEMMLIAQSGASVERRSLLTQAVLAMQLAVCLVLVVGAALFARTLWNLNHVSSGFDRETIVYGAPNFREAGLPGNEHSRAVMTVLNRLRHSPHISEVTLGPPPMVWGDGAWNYVTKASGYALAPDEDNTAWVNNVLPGYFSVMNIPLIAGRDFEERDRVPLSAPFRTRVIIVNETLARRFFGSRNPIGEQIVFSYMAAPNPTPWPLAIVGVVKDTKNKSLRDSQKAVAYLPLWSDGWAGVLARGKAGGTPETVEVEIRSAFALVSRTIVVDAGRVEDAVQRSLGRDRLVATLSAAFGVLGMLLASMGLYAAIAYSVSSRTREIGIRIAVGASAQRVSWLVLGQSLGVTAVGLLIGLLLAIAGSRLISSLLFEVSPSDPATLMASATVLAMTGLLAGWWPARRAARLDPSKTLRFE